MMQSSPLLHSPFQEELAEEAGGNSSARTAALAILLLLVVRLRSCRPARQREVLDLCRHGVMGDMAPLPELTGAPDMEVGARLLAAPPALCATRGAKG